MARGVKQKTGLNTDFSITDAAKRATSRRKMLEQAGNVHSNSTDDLNDELEYGNEPESIKSLFED